MPRWYKGFQCRGNSQTVVEEIRRVVHWHNLGSIVPVVRLEKQEGTHTKRGQFWLFLAIESPNTGEIPEKVQSTLLHIPVLKRPESVPFTYEHIQTMVGPEHEVHNYARSIPYMPKDAQHVSIDDPFDEVDKIPDQSDTVELILTNTQSYDRLLLWLSAIGSGTWQTFRNVCQAFGLDQEGSQSGRILRCLRLLGHLESSRDGANWSIAPPVLVLLCDLDDEGEREYLFCGQRDKELLQALRSVGNVQEYPQRDGNGPATIRVRASEAIEALAYLTGSSAALQLRITGNVSNRLVQLLPPLADWMSSLERLDGVSPHMFEIKRFNGSNFVDEPFQRKSGFYQFWPLEKMTIAGRPLYTLFYDEIKDSWFRGDWYGLRFLARQLNDNPCPVKYESSTRRLAIPKEWRWPELYERALVLASGQLPFQSDSWLIYDYIGPEILDELHVKLNLREEEKPHA